MPRSVADREADSTSRTPSVGELRGVAFGGPGAAFCGFHLAVLWWGVGYEVVAHLEQPTEDDRAVLEALVAPLPDHGHRGEVDELVVAEVAGKRTAAAQIALLVGHSRAERAAIALAVREVHLVGRVLRARLEARRGHEKLILSSLTGQDRLALHLGWDGALVTGGLLLGPRARLAGLVVVAAGQHPDRPDQYCHQDQDPHAGRRDQLPAPDRRGAPWRRRARRRCRRSAPRAAFSVRDRRHVAVRVELLEGVEQRPGPGAGSLRAAQVAPRGCGLGPGLLAQDVVGELAAPVLLHAARRDGGEVDQGIAGELAHTGLRQTEHVGQLAVALPLPQDQLDDRPLLVRELVEGRHMQAL